MTIQVPRAKRVRKPHRPEFFPPGTTQREAAIHWMKRIRHLWEGKTLERGDMNWKLCAMRLKAEGVYAEGSYAWDLRIDKLIAEIKADEGFPGIVKRDLKDIFTAAHDYEACPGIGLTI